MLAIQRGEASAYRRLSEQYLPKVLNFAFRLLSDRSEAEDVAQDTFLRVWQHASKWKPTAAVSTWIFRIAHNLCIDRLRKRKPADEESADLPASQGPSQMLERKRAAGAVQAAIDDLPERQRAALLLAHFEGLTNPEVAASLGVGVEAVESLLSRARRRLRGQLETMNAQRSRP